MGKKGKCNEKNRMIMKFEDERKKKARKYMTMLKGREGKDDNDKDERRRKRNWKG